MPSFPWKRIETSLNGTVKRLSAPPMPQAAGGQDGPPLTRKLSGAAASPDEWEMLFAPVSPRYRYEDLILSQSVQARLESALALVTCHPILYDAWGLRAKEPYGGGLSLNLYGPPGTGKSMSAEAVAERLLRMVIRIKYADIISKYPGDTNKAIAGAFRAAERAAAVLILEEADALLGKRLTHVASGADVSVNEAVSEMLAALDRHQGLVIFTTNKFSNYDEAFPRRIESIRLDLPDAACRVRLWQSLLPPAMPRTPDVTPKRLAEASDGFSGGDMVKVRRKAAARAALRSGVAGPVTWTDFADAVAEERAGKEDHQGGLRVVSETVVKREELPPAAKAAFDANSGQ
jgi:SpoVK/Ycf46/Vps4 family AAA+-type ATPase